MPVTGGGYVFGAIRPEFTEKAQTLGHYFSLYAFADDFPGGAWLDAPQYVPAGGAMCGYGQEHQEVFLLAATRS